MGSRERRAMIFLACGLFAWPGAAAAQLTTVNGMAIDDRTEQPLARVLVYVEEHPFFAESGEDGRFTLSLPPGTYSVAASLIGYAFTRQTVAVRPGADATMTLRLAEGAGTYTERVTVAGEAPRDAEAAAGGAALHGRELQDLRGLMLDDPLRAVQALPSATATDDFYSEFAVRGSGFRHIGLSVDGVPSRYLLHTVHGVTDGGSIAMVNSETLGAVTLLPGSYPQRTGPRLGAHLDLMTREGSREAFRGRVGLSGTSASVLGEGPLGNGRGSWLASIRRSYLDLLIKQIDEDATFAFGFTDAQSKIVYDVTSRHQIQALALVGRSDFDENPEDLGANDEARATGVAWLSALTWRYAPGARFTVSPRVYATGVDFRNRNAAGASLDSGGRTDIGWRVEGSAAPTDGWLVEFGAEGQWVAGRHEQRRTLDAAPAPSLVAAYDERSRTAGAHALVTIKVAPFLTIVPGARVDYSGLVRETTTSPWITGELVLSSRTRVRAGAGLHRQFPDFDQLFGVSGARTPLQPERARHTDVGIEQALSRSMALRVTWYQRNENDVLWTPGAESRRLADGSIRLGRGDARWANALDGRANGVEVLMRRDAPGGLTGWAGYAYSRLRYTETATGETFWADTDQRHTLSLYGRYAVSNRSSLSAKFRYGSNYPLLGYVREHSAPAGAAPLFTGAQPLFYSLGDQRNTLRLPAYARLDVRGDRTFNWSGRRLTLFAEVANVLNRTNVRNAPYGIDRAGRVYGPTDTLMPIVPSAGFVVEF